MQTTIEQQLAILGGSKAVPENNNHKELFHWPIVTEEDENAVLEVLQAGNMPWATVTAQRLSLRLCGPAGLEPVMRLSVQA